MTNTFVSFETVYTNKLEELQEEYPAFIKAVNFVLASRFQVSSKGISISESSFNQILEGYIKELHPEINLQKVHKYDHKHILEFQDILAEKRWLLEVNYNADCYYVFKPCIGHANQI